MEKIVNQILGKKEAAVYLAVLELATASVQNIAKKARVPRSTCYLIIDELKKKGLITEIIHNNRTRVVAEPPKRLISLIQRQIEKFFDRQKILQSILPELDALYNTHPYKPVVRFYEGFTGVKTVLEKTLKANEILVFCSGYDKPIKKKLSAYLDKYFAQVDKRSIKTYELVGPAPDLQEYIAKYHSPPHQIKLLPKKQPNNGTIEQLSNQTSHIDKLIYQNKLAIISFETLHATVIEHKPIVDFEKRLFWKLWKFA